MKTLSLFILALLASAQIVSAQSAARDWTKTDCYGQTHNLFSELDNGSVIIMEFVMLDCAPCVTAGKGMTSLLEQHYAMSHPGKVKLYSIGYMDEYTCSQMEEWRTVNGFSHTTFIQGSQDLPYYGEMGMPTIVIVGGPSHAVYYNKLGFSPMMDSPVIMQSIDQALAELSTAVPEEHTLSSYTLSPSPVHEELTLSLGSGIADRIVVCDLTGREVIDRQVDADSRTLVLNTQALSTGVYCLRFLHKGVINGHTMFVVENR